MKSFNFHGLVGCSQSMRDIISVIERVAGCDATVLLEGESGTGKELLAHAVHQLSPRCGKSFMVINCSTIVGSLMESELFGHERGSFTGADDRKAGKFETADHGTVFLDEIAELPLALQPKLLRIIQEREFTRVGGAKPLKSDVRIVAATNRDLAAMVQDGTFRKDLYYRLKVVQIRLPALRRRPEDIPLLVDHFVAAAAKKYGRTIQGADKDALFLLVNYGWPGNVRDLEHIVERAVVMCETPLVTAKDIVFEDGYVKGSVEDRSYKTALSGFHKTFLPRVLTAASGNKRGAARLLGISHARLYRLLLRHGVPTGKNGEDAASTGAGDDEVGDDGDEDALGRADDFPDSAMNDDGGPEEVAVSAEPSSR